MVSQFLKVNHVIAAPKFRPPGRVEVITSASMIGTEKR